MNRRHFCIELLGTGAGIAGLAQLATAAPPSQIPAPSKIRWHHSLKSAHKLAIELDRPMLVVFGASWCTYCHKLERETLADKRITSLVEREFIPVHLDFDRDSKIAKVLEVEKLPCTVVLSPQADLLNKLEGYAQFKEYHQALQTAQEKRAEIQQVKAAESTR